MKDTDQKSPISTISSVGRSHTRRKTGFWIALMVGVGLFSGLLWYVTPSELWNLVKQVDIRLLLLALLIKLSSTVIRSVQFGLFVPLTKRFLAAYGVFSVTRLLNIALPFRSGELVLLTLLKRAGLSRTIAGTIPIWLVIRISDLIGLATWVSLLIALSRFGEDYGHSVYAALAVFILALGFVHLAPRLVPDELKLRGNRWVVDRLTAVIDGLRHVRSANRKTASVGLGLLIWACLIGASVATQAALNSPFGIWDCALMTALGLAISLLPIHAPMGIGTGEAMWSAVMVLFGLPLQEAMTLAFGIRFVTLATACVEGAVGYLIVWRLGIWSGARPGTREHATSP